MWKQKPKIMKKDVSYEIQFAEYIGARAYEFLDYKDGVGHWESEDGLVVTTESMYVDFINIKKAISQMDKVGLELKQ